MEAGGTLQPQTGWEIALTQLSAFQGRLLDKHMEQGKHYRIVPVRLEQKSSGFTFTPLISPNVYGNA